MAAFRPDFYLPAYDLFIEITTLSQRLVTKKNAKVRRLRELYPEVEVKVLYQRDYLNLLVKYGLEGPSRQAASRVPRRSVSGRSVSAGSVSAGSVSGGSVSGGSVSGGSVSGGSVSSGSARANRRDASASP